MQIKHNQRATVEIIYLWECSKMVMMKCDKDKKKMIKITMKKRIIRIRMKGSQGEERESFVVGVWAFVKTDKGGWERGASWGDGAEELVEVVEVVVSGGL